MSKRQIKGMIRFHRKAERAYRAAGNFVSAQRAHEMRANLLERLRHLKKS